MSRAHLPDPVPHFDSRYDSAPNGSLLCLANRQEKFDQLIDEEMINSAELTMEDVEEMYQRSLIDFAHSCPFLTINGYARSNYPGAMMVFAWAVGEGRIKVIDQTDDRLEVITLMGGVQNNHYLFSKEK